MSDCCILHIILLYITKPISLRRIQENTKDVYKRDIYIFLHLRRIYSKFLINSLTEVLKINPYP